MTQFAALQKGVIELPAVLFFTSLIALALYVNTQIVASRKAS
jgi:hypothetical protein